MNRWEWIESAVISGDIFRRLITSLFVEVEGLAPSCEPHVSSTWISFTITFGQMAWQRKVTAHKNGKNLQPGNGSDIRWYLQKTFHFLICGGGTRGLPLSWEPYVSSTWISFTIILIYSLANWSVQMRQALICHFLRLIKVDLHQLVTFMSFKQR